MGAVLRHSDQPLECVLVHVAFALNRSFYPTPSSARLVPALIHLSKMIILRSACETEQPKQAEIDRGKQNVYSDV